MVTQYEIKEIVNNPKAHYAENRSIELKTAYKIKLFNIWKENQSQLDVEMVLDKDGLGKSVTGPDFCQNLCNTFRSCGFPSYKYSEDMPKPFVEDNPLVLSGKFKRTGNGKSISMNKDFEKEIFSQYPEISVESLLENAGIDLVDMGYVRLSRLKKSFDERLKQQYNSVVNNLDNPSSDQANPLSNPYVKAIDNGIILLKEAFYNEVYLLERLTFDEKFKLYELDKYPLSTKNRAIIFSRMCNWQPTKEKIDESSELVSRIQIKRLEAMNTMVQDGFKQMAKAYKKMPIESRRILCQHLAILPRDTMGIYSLTNIRELVGIPRSTYYALLNDENYGKGTQRQTDKDENDIEVIREVLSYKDFEKGIRQVYMLIPKLKGKYLSMYRIRRLMNKYGIRTTIRRPSRNRKAMKELIERNKKANLLMRKFKLHRPNKVRLTDVTYLDFGDNQRAYGSASIDPVTGKLICFVLSENNDLKLALDTLKEMDKYPAQNGAILHSDQGTLYMTDDFQAAVVERNLKQSMSRRGNCWDNAVQESFFGHFKDECHYEKCKTIEELQKCIDDYSYYYNNERGIWSKGRMTPVEYEKYLTDMDEEDFVKYLENETEKYLEMKEKSAKKAMETAKEYKNSIEKVTEVTN